MLSLENQTRAAGALTLTGIISGIINGVKKAIENVIGYATTVAKDMLDYGIEEIRTQIIDEIGKQVQDILSQLFSGVSQILDQFWDLIEKTNCAVISGNVDKILEFLDDLGSGCSALDACCRQIGYYLPVSLRQIASEAPTKLYDLKICRRLGYISEKTGTQDLAKAYVDAQITARKFFCANYGSSGARDHFSQEYTNWGAKYFIWAKVADSGCHSPQACYDVGRRALDSAQQLLPPSLVTESDVLTAGQGVTTALATPGKCDCYMEEIAPDTGSCPGNDCEWVGCSKEGYFVSGFLFSKIDAHGGYELVPNGYSSRNAPVRCCRPCFSFPAAAEVSQAFEENIVVPTALGGCAKGSDCYTEALSTVAGLRGSLQGMAGKRSLELLTDSVKAATVAGFNTCGECKELDLGSDTGECSGNDCEWAECPADDGSFLVGLLFTKILGHDGYELVPNGYSSSLKSTKCCTSCLRVVPPAQLVTHARAPLEVSANCGDALGCYESAISLLDTALDEANAKATKADLASCLDEIHAVFASGSTWANSHMEDLGSNEGVCNDDCEWAQCTQPGSLLTGHLYTKLLDHDGYELVPNGYAPTLKPARCASPSFSFGVVQSANFLV